MKLSLITKLKSDPLLLWVVVSRAIAISSLIDSHSKSIYCPFHDDTGKPSAMLILNDNDQIEKIHCFVCSKKQFTSYDFIKTILNQKPLDYLLANVNELIVEGIMSDALLYKESINQEKINIINSTWNNCKNDLKLFLLSLYKE